MAQWAAIFGGGSRDREEGGSNIFSLLFMMIVAPIAAMLIQMAVSRSREYMADEGGAKVTGDPLALGERAAQAAHGRAEYPAASEQCDRELDGAYVYRQSADRRRLR